MLAALSGRGTGGGTLAAAGELGEILDIAVHAGERRGALVRGKRLVERDENLRALGPPRIEALLFVRRAAFVPAHEVLGHAGGEALRVLAALGEQREKVF